MAAYYNERDPFCAEWLRNLAADGFIPAGVVDERSIVDVRPDDLRGFAHVHLFAGLGGWAYAARLAGWDAARPLWTGSPPCQPHTRANPGRRGLADERHLWPHMARLVRACRPPVLFGEQSADAIANGWLDEVADDLEGAGYTVWAKGIPACAVGAEHERLRLWFAADAGEPGLPLSECEAVQRARRREEGAATARGYGWSAQSGLVPVLHGIPGRVGGIKAAGNAIVPQVGAEILAAYLDGLPDRPGQKFAR